MRTSYATRVFELADERNGYLTAALAREAGIPGIELVKMARRGILERVSRGVYRLIHYPYSPRGQWQEAVLWPQEGVEGVLSHESALVLHALSDVSPSKVHITLAPTYRTRRVPPAYLVVHRASLTVDEVERIDGIPVTRPARTIRDCHATDLRPTLIRQAIDEAATRGLLLRTEAAALGRELLSEKRKS